MQEKNIEFVSLGCRLNVLEAEKIKNMLGDADAGPAVVINTCSVTGEAERQSKQAIRRIIRENPDAKVFVTGCGATRDPDGFAAIAGVTRVILNKDKMDINAYVIPLPPVADKGIQVDNNLDSGVKRRNDELMQASL